VSLAGRLIDGPAAIVASRAVLEMPPAERSRAGLALTSGWRGARGVIRREIIATSADLSRQYHAYVRGDGLYYFLDLPAGNYVLGGRDELGRPIEPKPALIPSAKEGRRTQAVLGLNLSACADQAQAVDSPVGLGSKVTPAKRGRHANQEFG
jgi:hypothetical protein